MSIEKAPIRIDAFNSITPPEDTPAQPEPKASERPAQEEAEQAPKAVKRGRKS